VVAVPFGLRCGVHREWVVGWVRWARIDPLQATAGADCRPRIAAVSRVKRWEGGQQARPGSRVETGAEGPVVVDYSIPPSPLAPLPSRAASAGPICTGRLPRFGPVRAVVTAKAKAFPSIHPSFP